METTLRHIVALAAVLASIAVQPLFADDVIVLQNKKEIRCRITEFSGGIFTYKDASGKVARIGQSSLARIRFDVPEAAAAGGVAPVGPSIEQVNAFPEKFVG